MNSKTIKKHGSNKKYLRQDKNCLLCKTQTKHLLVYNPILKTEKREMAIQLTKCGECQKNKSTFLKEIKPRKKISILQNMHMYCKNCQKHR